jgi:hypothetical protein
MNYSGFVYSDFLYLTLANDSAISLSNLNISYTQVNNNQFNLNITPGNSPIFQGLNICAFTKQKSQTSLQLSKNLTNLANSVYGQQSCLVWSLSSANIFEAN